MGFINRIKVFVSIILCVVTGGNFFGSTLNYIRAGNLNMIKNDHTKAFATEYTELVSYAREHEDTISWFDGMVTGNGENGVVCSGSPYTDSLIYNNTPVRMPFRFRSRNRWTIRPNCQSGNSSREQSG